MSELAIGIGPFVVGPAVERKMGTSAFSTLAINATEWFNAKWAMEKGLYADIFASAVELDDAVAAKNPRIMMHITSRLASVAITTSMASE